MTTDSSTANDLSSRLLVAEGIRRAAITGGAGGLQRPDHNHPGANDRPQAHTAARLGDDVGGDRDRVGPLLLTVDEA